MSPQVVDLCNPGQGFEALSTLVETDSSQTVRGVDEELRVNSHAVFYGLKRNGKVKKCSKSGFPVFDQFFRNCHLSRYVLLCVCATKTIIFWSDRQVWWNVYHLRQQKTFRTVVGHWWATQALLKCENPLKKTLVTLWWSAAGVIHYNFLQLSQTMTAESYCEEVDEMYRKFRQQPTLVNKRDPILLHNNARPRVSQITVQKLNKLSIEVLPHPPYSPYLSPTDCQLSKHFDNFLSRRTFANQDQTKTAFVNFIESRALNFYADGINRLVLCWPKCTDSNGAYFAQIEWVFTESLKLTHKNGQNYWNNLIPTLHCIIQLIMLITVLYIRNWLLLPF